MYIFAYDRSQPVRAAVDADLATLVEHGIPAFAPENPYYSREEGALHRVAEQLRKGGEYKDRLMDVYYDIAWSADLTLDSEHKDIYDREQEDIIQKTAFNLNADPEMRKLKVEYWGKALDEGNIKLGSADVDSILYSDITFIQASKYEYSTIVDVSDIYIVYVLHLDRVATIVADTGISF